MRDSARAHTIEKQGAMVDVHTRDRVDSLGLELLDVLNIRRDLYAHMEDLVSHPIACRTSERAIEQHTYMLVAAHGREGARNSEDHDL